MSQFIDRNFPTMYISITLFYRQDLRSPGSCISVEQSKRMLRRKFRSLTVTLARKNKVKRFPFGTLAVILAPSFMSYRKRVIVFKAPRRKYFPLSVSIVLAARHLETIVSSGRSNDSLSVAPEIPEKLASPASLVTTPLRIAYRNFACRSADVST